MILQADNDLILIIKLNASGSSFTKMLVDLLCGSRYSALTVIVWIVFCFSSTYFFYLPDCLSREVKLKDQCGLKK